jgi:hypothetical protein
MSDLKRCNINEHQITSNNIHATLHNMGEYDMIKLPKTDRELRGMFPGAFFTAEGKDD